MTKYYIRFGDIPEDELSGMGGWSNEIGVSCYHAVQIDGKFSVALPPILNNFNFNTLLSKIYHANAGNIKVYVISGKRVGTGGDGEPLLKNIKILRDITSNYVVTTNIKKVYKKNNEITKTNEECNELWWNGIKELTEKTGYYISAATDNYYLLRPTSERVKRMVKKKTTKNS
jgi:hypothetical protein